MGNIPYLAYELTLPEGVEPGPLTITFINPGGKDYVQSGLPLSGRILWPGADTDPPMWPGWALVNGEYVNIGNGNFGWTRNGVTVTFEVNPSYSTTVNYPPASVACANPPSSPATRASTKCVGNALVTKHEEFVDGQWVTTSTSTINGAKRCEHGGPPVKEEGF